MAMAHNDNIDTGAQGPYVITIGRQFGSGGRQLGQALAQAFGIEYYDKRLLLEAAKSAGVDTAFFERADERAPRFLAGNFQFNMGFSAQPWYSESSISDDALYRSQAQVVESLASRGSCVIVGRSADYILREHPSRRVDIFVHAPMEACVARILERHEAMTGQQARQLAERANKLRANYYNFYTEKRWGRPESYDLCVDSSKLTLEGAVELVATYIRVRYGFDPRQH